LWVWLFGVVSGLDNGLALTPPMGWNSWNHFACDVSEDLIKQTADRFVSLGLSEAGYEFVNIDDCWQVSRDRHGFVVEDPDRFPSGMGKLSEYVHSKGLKFGLYSDAGVMTCQQRPGSLGFESQDALKYAEWKVDYLKYDNCFNNDIPERTRYPPMARALNQTGHPIVFSMCEWGNDDPATWAAKYANLWRTTGDIEAKWSSILSRADQNSIWHKFAGPSAWNDPDMLEVGNRGVSYIEARSHFAMWSIMKAPLLLGNDLDAMDQETLALVKNPEIIAVNQDPLGIQAPVVYNTSEVTAWAGPLSGGDFAFVLVNRLETPLKKILPWSVFGFAINSKFHVRDLYSRSSLGILSEVTVELSAHDSVMLRLSASNSKTVLE